MSLPTSSQFSLFDWNGGVKVSDPVAGIPVTPEVDISHGAPYVTEFFDIHHSSPSWNLLTVGDVLTEDLGAWTATLVSKSSTVLRVLLTAGSAPVAGQSFSGGPPITVEAEEVDGVLAFQTGGPGVTVSIPIPIPAQATLEFRLVPISLPARANGSDGHVFVGLLNAPGHAVGLSFSQQGIAIVGDPESSGVALEDSDPLLTGADLTIRIVLQSEESLLYITETSQLSVTGHVLRYTSAPTSTTLTDQVLVSVRPLAGATHSFEIKSLRADDSAIIPNARPVADPGDDRIVQLGEYARLDGSESSDPEASPLEYRWSVTYQPSGSNMRLRDPVEAYYTATFPDTTTLTLTSNRYGASGNGVGIEFEAGGAFSVTVVGGGLLVTYTAATTVAEVVAALMDNTDPGYSLEGAALVSAVVDGNDANLIATIGPLSGLLDHGADGTGRVNFFKPDKLGTYRIALTVNDGQLDSDPVEMLIQVIEAKVQLGYVPDGNIFWKNLPDFWTKVADKGHITTFFSSLLQIITAEMTKVWQHGYSNSLETIPRYFQRRWLSYEAKLDGDFSYICGEALFPITRAAATLVDDDDDDLTTRMLAISSVNISGGLSTYEPGDSLVVWPGWDPSPILLTVAKVQPLLVSGTGFLPAGAPATGDRMVLEDAVADFISAGVEVGDIVTILGGTYGGKRFRVAAVQTKQLTLSTPAPIASETVSYRIGGFLFVEEDELEAYTLIDSSERDGYRDPVLLDEFKLARGEFDGVLAGDLLWLYNPNTGKYLTSYEVLTPSATMLQMTVPMASYTSVSWKVVRPRTSVTIFAYPVFEAAGVDDLDEVAEVNDVALLTAEIEGTEYEWPSQIIAIRDNRFATIPSWRNTGSPVNLVADGTYKEPLQADSLSVSGIWRTDRIPVDVDIEHIPRLQTSPGNPSDPYLYGRDFGLESGSRFIVWTHTIEDGVIDQIEYTTDGTVLVLSGVDAVEDGVEVGQTIVIPIGTTGVTYTTFGFAKVIEVTDSTHVLVDWFLPPDVAAAVALLGEREVRIVLATEAFNKPFYISKFGAYNLPPEHLWAETTVFSNDQTVEDNFGIAVGFPREMLEDNELRLDYLSAVRGIWFALWDGPVVSNIRLGSHIFFNLPFAEEAGTITEIDDEYSSTLGRIVIQSDKDSARFKTYFWPITLDVDTNPVTGVAYVVGDHINAFSPLCAGIEVLDYVKDPTWMSGVLEGPNELEKFHTFVVRADFAGYTGDGGKAFERLIEFVQTIKPKHTKVILLGLTGLDDEISVTDHLDVSAVVELIDEPYTTEDVAGFGSWEANSWLPEDVDGNRLRSGFIHYLDAYDGEGHQPLQLFPEHSNKARHKLWFSCSAKDTFSPGEIVFRTPGYGALRIEEDGPSWISAVYLPWVVALESTTPWAASGYPLGSTVTGPDNLWSGVVILDGGVWAAIALDNDHIPWDAGLGILRNGRFPVIGDSGVNYEIVDRYLQPPWTPPAVGTFRSTDGLRTFTTASRADFPDYIGVVSRMNEVHPETFVDGLLAFFCGGATAYTLGCTVLAGVGPPNVLWENAVPGSPQWISRLYAMDPAAGPGLPNYLHMVLPTLRVYTTAGLAGIAIGDTIYGGSLDTRWCLRVLYINGTDLYCERMNANAPLFPAAFVNGAGGSGTLTGDAAFTQNAPLLGDTFSSADGGAGTADFLVNNTGCRYPTLGMGLVIDDRLPFYLPVKDSYAQVIEVVDGSAFTLYEHVQFLGTTHTASVIAKSASYIVVWDLDYVPGAGRVVRGIDSGATTTVVRTWDRDEYSVPNMVTGQYCWLGTPIVSDFLLRVYYNGVLNPLETALVDNMYAPARWRAEVVALGGGPLTYVDLDVTQGYPRSQPVRGQSIIGVDLGDVLTVRPENWAVQWIPGTSLINNTVRTIPKVLDTTPSPRWRRKASTTTADSAIIAVVGV